MRVPFAELPSRMEECQDMFRGSRFSLAFAVLACAAALAIAGCGALGQVGAGVHVSPSSAYSVTGRITTVVINGGSGSITVTGIDHGAIRVSQQPSYSDSKKPPVTTRRVSGSTLTLSYTCPAEFVCGVTYDVQVPPGVAVRAATREGSITLTSVTGPVTARTVAGFISATSLASPSATLKSSAGGINASFTVPPGSVQASTTAGPISLAVPNTVSYKVNGHTYVGKTTVTVRQATASTHTITAHSDLGSITISPS
jgi:hypothetical protein